MDVPYYSFHIDVFDLWNILDIRLIFGDVGAVFFFFYFDLPCVVFCFGKNSTMDLFKFQIWTDENWEKRSPVLFPPLDSLVEKKQVMFFFFSPVVNSPVSVHLCPLQPQIPALGWTGVKPDVSICCCSPFSFWFNIYCAFWDALLFTTVMIKSGYFSCCRLTWLHDFVTWLAD